MTETTFERFCRIRGCGGQDAEKILGPNVRAVLNFWNYWDGLDLEQMGKVDSLYRLKELSAEDIWDSMTAASKIIPVFKSNAWYAPYGKPNSFRNASVCAGYATYELIGMHLLIERNAPLIFLPLFENL